MLNRNLVLAVTAGVLLVSASSEAQVKRRAPSSVPTEITQLDSLNMSKAGNLRFSYTVPGGCEHHDARVEAEVTTGQNDHGMNVVTGARIRISDISEHPDNCGSPVRVEGNVNVMEAVQAAADSQNALIEDRRIPIALPQISTFTGK